ncbi:MAG: hypothetical protein JWP64_1640 [Pseudonocardia sp.]|nr:hypothetical protein [Pseudonocardia sp.]MDT7700706.1 hypothetical protein [Pseudonocardiales bacterium]
MQVMLQRVMSGGTLVLGLLLALWFDASGTAGAQPLGWLLAGLGALGLVASFLLPARADSRKNHR